ncbi:hypothetical protein DYB30_012737, partial [Aphanomyces astaci]
VGASSSSGGLVTRQNPLAGGAANGVHLASELLRGTNRPLHNFSMQSPRDSAREMLVYDLKVHLDNQMDDHTFRDLLMHKSRVLSGKDWFRWNWDIISELLEGPLTNPVRLSEAMKTKFFKRVSGFFRCDNSDKGYFAGLPWTPDYVPYLRPACQMYTLLLNHPEGIAFLKTDRRYSLRLYATCLLRALLRSEVEGFERWGIESLVAQLDKETSVARAALSVLEEAAESPVYLSAMIKKRPLQLVHLQAESLLLKFLSLPEGLAFLKDVPNWIPTKLVQWRQSKVVNYVHVVESHLLRGVFRDKQSVTTNTSKAALKPVPIPVTVPNRRRLEWLFRMPWNIEVKLVGPPGSGPPAHLTIDAYVDASEVRHKSFELR